MEANTQPCSNMPSFIDRNPENIPGRFYVDDSCIDCDFCRDHAPEFFKRHDEGSYSYVHRQPVTEAEVAAAREALDSCPSESIGEGDAP
jgi:ferredoxin